MNLTKDLSNLQFHPMKEADLADVLAIEVDSFPDPWTREGFLELMASDQFRSIVAKIDDDIVGYVVYQRIQAEYDIHSIAVKKDYRTIGIGSKILDLVIQDADESGVRDIYLQVRVSNFSAQSVYAKKGFKRVGIRPRYFTSNNEDAIIMKREKSSELGVRGSE